MTDADLLQEWRTARDARTFREIAARYASMVYATCTRILGNPTEAEDVTQECFEILASTTRAPDRNLGAWLHRVATTRSLNRIRETKRRAAREAEFADRQRAEAATDAHGAIEWRDIYRHVDEAIAELPDELRIPLVAHYLQGDTHRAIAKSLGIPRRTAGSRIERALYHVAASLKRRGVSIAGGALATLFVANLAEAATLPAALSAALGKTALAQATAGSAQGAIAAAGGAKALGGALTLKTGTVAAAAIAFIVTGAWLATHSRETEQAVAIPAASVVEATPNAPSQATSSSSETAIGKAGAAESHKDTAKENNPRFARLGIGTCGLYGTVAHPGGRPAPGAEVTAVLVEHSGVKRSRLEGPPKRVQIARTVADAEGRYRFRGLPDGEYGLCAKKGESYGTGHEGVPSHPNNREPLFEKEVDIELVNGPLTETSGTVRNSEGVPLAGARVVPLRASTGQRALDMLLPAIADEQGQYVMRSLWPTPRELEASAEGYAPAVLTPVQAGSADNDFVLHGGGRISGTMMHRTTDEPLPGIVLMAKKWKGAPLRTTTDEAGRYAFEHLSPGISYTLTPLTDDFLILDEPKIVVNDGETADGVDIRLSRGGSVSGTVTVLETGDPLPGATVWYREHPNAHVQRRTKTGPDGKYTLTLLPEGTHAVECVPPDCVVHAADPYGRIYPISDPLNIRLDEEVAAVDFTFDRGTHIGGRVVDTDGKPIEGVEIVFRSWGRQRIGGRSATTNDEGHFRLVHLRVGCDYRVWTKAEGYYKGRCPVYSLPPSGADDLLFVLGRGATVSGRVVYTAGEPIADAKIAIHRLQWPPQIGDMTIFPGPSDDVISDKDGHFEMHSIGPGTPRFVVDLQRAPERRPQLAMHRPLTVDNGDIVTDLQLVIMREGGIAGVVRDAATGHPVQDFRISVVRRKLPDGTPDRTGARGALLPGLTNGQFELNGVVPGLVTIEVQAPGYATEAVIDIDVKSGCVTEGVEVLLTPPAAVEGRLTCNGTPLTGQAWVQVSSERFHTATGRRAWTRACLTANVSRDGAFRIDDLTVGPHHVVACMEIGGSERLVMVAANIETQPGETTRVDLDFGASKGVRGTVAIPAGFELYHLAVRKGATLEPLPIDDLPTCAQQVRSHLYRLHEAGSFEVASLPQGTYTVTAVCGRSGDGMAGLLLEDSRVVTVSEGAITEVHLAP